MRIVHVQIGKMETQLKKWGTMLDELVAKAEAAGAESQSGYRKRIDDLRSKHLVARAKLDELRAAGSGKWEAFKPGIENALSELEGAFKDLPN